MKSERLLRTWAEMGVDGVDVVVVGSPESAQRAARRYATAGARVRLVARTARAVRCDRAAESRPGLAVVVDEEGPSHESDEVIDAYRSMGVPIVHAPAVTTRGHVTLVGGGPGPTDLLTGRALLALQDADIVFFDRLGPTENLRALSGGAHLIDVGKTPGFHRIGQKEIENRIVDFAREGLNVVRLKGGDPYVFGRGGEEVAACTRAGIAVSVVPGVTSAVSVPSAAGIPVTMRGITHAFTVVSGHAPLSPEEHRHLVGLNGTIVVLMGLGTLSHLTAGLRNSGMSSETPVALIERGFSPEQRTTVTTLEQAAVAAIGHRSPIVIVIGDVVDSTDSARAVELAQALGA